jgi:transitional endoplasmic reticulum ATPase
MLTCREILTAILRLLHGVGFDSQATIYLPLLNGVYHPFGVALAPTGSVFGPSTKVTVVSATLAERSLERQKYVQISSNISERLQWMVRGLQNVRQGQLSHSLGLPHSLLITGLSGTGKSTISLRLIQENETCVLLSYTPAEIQILMDEDSDAVKLIYDRASDLSKSQPVILFFDDLDVLLAQDDVSELASQTRSEQLFIECFQNVLNSFKPSGESSNILVVASATHPDKLNPILRRLFQSEMAIEPLTPAERRKALKSMLDSGLPDKNLLQVTEEQIFDVADSSVGFNIGELEALVRTSYMLWSTSNGSAKERGVTSETLHQARQTLRPVAIRTIGSAQVTKTTWSEICGLGDVKSRLMNATSAIFDATTRAAYKRFGIQPARGIMLYGPPGTGKTLLGKAVATESKANFIYANLSEILSSELGQSEAAVATLFRSARRVAPSIIFFDEIQATFGSRDASGHFGRSMIAQLILEMEANSPEPVLVMAATNRPDFMDKSIIRAGRFDELIYIPPPTAAARREILSLYLKPLKLREGTATPAFIEELSSKTHNFTGADLKNLCARAGMKSLMRDIDAALVEAEDFRASLREMESSVTQQMLEIYYEFQK